MKFQDLKIGTEFHHDGQDYRKISPSEIWVDSPRGHIDSIKPVNCLRLKDSKLAFSDDWNYVEPLAK